jgi:hypothetical protein
MVIHDLSIHEKGGSRWVGPPAREWTDSQGRKQYVPVIEFRDRGTQNRFRDQVLAALDKYLEQLEEQEQQIESAAPRSL